MMSAKTWQNRIVRYSNEAPDQLLANPANWRTHSGRQADALRGVLGDVGIVQNVIANVRSGFLIDGHLRVMEAMRSNQPTIPVTWVDLSPAEEALVLATLDPLSALAGTDAAKLDELLREISTDDPAVQQMLDDLATSAGIVPNINAEPARNESISEQWLIVVTCINEAQQVDLLQQFQKEGLSCRALIS
jgi:ParB-like chromosome segregation protein Spo0J